MFQKYMDGGEIMAKRRKKKNYLPTLKVLSVVFFIIVIIGVLYYFNLPELFKDDYRKYHDNPELYGVLEKNTYITGYTDTEFINDNEIEEIRQEVISKEKKYCSNIWVDIVSRTSTWTNLDFYGDCYARPFNIRMCYT